ncbi:hypothetical protein HU727_000460 [Pseudomonas sp. SWRI153]|uniref:Uncharacterized protein n=1 Tax=Pseudomonas khorasanensis TaxID=2745508 RepID=A0A923F5T6_9PSED|nr:hypothetical protein [Pseudomonas khorasanensis]MBV4484054.1 hypothetical protein [Pseudomonas khorasanensis]
MSDYPMDETDTDHRNRQFAQALGLDAYEVELWVSAIEEDGSGMGYVVHFSSETPVDVLAKVQGLGEDLMINIGPID